MICTGCKLKNDHADANQPDGSYLCFDCRRDAKASGAKTMTTNGIVFTIHWPSAVKRRFRPGGIVSEHLVGGRGDLHMSLTADRDYEVPVAALDAFIAALKPVTP